MIVSVVRKSFAGLTALSLTLTPVLVIAQEENSPSLSQMVEEREKRAQDEAAKKKGRGIGGWIADTLPAVIGLGTTVLCGGTDSGNSSVERLGCLALGTLAGYGAAELKNSIRKRINEKEQAELLAAAADSLSDGQPRFLAFPESGATGSVTPSATLVFEDAKMEMFYDSVTLASRERVEVIGQPYLTSASANLRNSPGTDGPPVKTFAKETPLHVVGQVPGQDWYMVSQKVEEGDAEALMVIGYISSDLLVPAPDDFQLPSQPAPATVQLAEFEVALRCNELTFEVQDAKGKRATDKSKNCIGPEGQFVSA